MTFMSIAIFLGSHHVRLFSITEKDVAMYLNRNYPALRESVDLLIIDDEELSRLQLLQKNRTVQQFEAIYPTIKLPHQMGRAIIIFGFSVLLSVVLTAFLKTSDPKQGATSPGKILNVEPAGLTHKN